MFRVFNPMTIQIVFQAETFDECWKYKLSEGSKNVSLGFALRIIHPDDESFDKTYKLIH